MDKSILPPMTKKSTPGSMVRRMVDRAFDTSGGMIKKRKRADKPVNQFGVSGYMKSKKKTTRELDKALK